jgi:serine/threonine-protein kinase
VLYEMLTGNVPFTGDTPVEIAMKHLSQIPEPPSKLRPEVPHDLDAVVMRALSKEPDQRYGSTEEMDADLARVARGVAVAPETEDAMTQVLSGVGATTAQTMITRPRAVAPPPAPPSYRSPGPYYDYEEPPRGRSIWPWLLALGLVLAGAIGGWFLYTKIQQQIDTNRPVSVPDVRLMQKDLAVLKIQQAKLKPIVVKAADDNVPSGQVIDENPGSGAKVGRGSTVTLKVSTGKPKVDVPDVRGRSVTDAITALVGIGLNPKISHVYSSQPPDTVTGQFPPAPAKVLKGSNVRINVSRGAKPVPVPDVIGQPYLNAKSALEGQGFVVKRVNVQSDQAAGVVVTSDPQPNTPSSKGATITLSVSKGPSTTQVPAVLNLNQAEAERLVTDAGLTPSVAYQPVTDPSQDGIVIGQNPDPFAGAKSGDVVIITVGQLQNGSPGGDGSTTTTTAGQ